MTGSGLTRKQFLTSIILSAAAPAVALGQDPPQQGTEITLEDLKVVEKVVGIEFTDEERAQLLQSVRGFRNGYRSIRDLKLPNAVSPATVFRPTGRQPEESKATSI